ncbi:MutS-related protein [Paraflavitalea pollutisoli]|uniref:MutS-related protein n=1 Tax=Paraflavitalea pollutisoli TaxID=3034143 RepID=UPI0023EA9272|nr:hypothetical protein [Paraflavitalea sp. H1-2-19X]
MSFIIDPQTLSDLQVFGKYGRHGIDQLFRHTRTRGGGELLDQLLRYPLSDTVAINQRSAAIRFLEQQPSGFPLEPAWFDAAEQYLAVRDERSKLRSDGDAVSRKLNQLIGADTQYQGVVGGLAALREIMLALAHYVPLIDRPEAGELLLQDVAGINTLLHDPELATFLSEPVRKNDYAAIAAQDLLLRFQKYEQLLQLLRYCYRLDLYIAVGVGARRHSLSFAVATADAATGIVIDGLRHPLLPDAVGNDVSITPAMNVLFLTGANMAGKSTFMKAMGLAVYLAHAGFPVAATNMHFTVQEGLLTSINLADNLNQGYSHFYAEVLRVKQVAEHLSAGRRLFVLFDELFRGTNVKDAHEATVSITEAYGRHQHCSFVVSTHIIEAADALQLRCRNIRYVYLPTVMDGSIPCYTYQLREGITADRHGLVIINQEGIPGILAAGATIAGNAAPESAGKHPGFITDQQTLDDLHLTGKYKSRSAFSLYNETVTAGGEQLLEQYFREPLTDAAGINARAELFAFFRRHACTFPLDQTLYTTMSNYLRTVRVSRRMILYQGVLRRLRFLIGEQEPQQMAMAGLSGTLKGLALVRSFLHEPWAQQAPAPLRAQRDQLLKVLEGGQLGIKQAVAELDDLSWRRALHYESLLLGDLHEALTAAMHFLHELDVYISVGHISRRRGFTQAVAHPAYKQQLVLYEAWHPALDKAVTNDIYMDPGRHLIFLTGANMAGKSTIMKTLGTCVYLAHMGFPVPTRQMEFSVMEGLYTSINVADNLQQGHSHFYAEVMRVKKVSEALASGRQLLIIFDELFKGTNVKDAHDATYQIIRSLMAYTHCRFVISTHITEVGHALQHQAGQVQFRYMPTVMEGTVPRYPYRMVEGISEDRHGMLLINNEHVLEMLDTNANKPLPSTP